MAAALVVATRPLHVGSSPVLAMLLTEAGLRRVTPAPLGAEAVAVLVRDALGGDASAAFCAACADLSEGNPLLLGDLVRTVATAGLSPDDAGAGRLGKLLPASIGRAVDGPCCRLRRWWWSELDRLARFVRAFLRSAPVAEVVPLARRALGGNRLHPDEIVESQGHTSVLNVLTACDEFDAAAAGFEAAMERSRASGSVVGFGIAACFRSWIAHRTGRLLDAEADLDDALRVTAEGGLGIIDGYARAQLAAFRLDRGDPRGAAALFADVPDDLGQHRHSDARFLLYERGRLALVLTALSG